MGKGAQQTPGAGTLLAQAGPAGKVFTRDAVSKREDLCIVGNGRFSPAARRARARAPRSYSPSRARAIVRRGVRRQGGTGQAADQ